MYLVIVAKPYSKFINLRCDYLEGSMVRIEQNYYLLECLRVIGKSFDLTR
ncbi:hypothetical protein HanIR_Chr16g0812521 [Helianthus annuus]|nr:hypothetical protein HanIR_Chr16g0812521 [Helianthus annuus]